MKHIMVLMLLFFSLGAGHGQVVTVSDVKTGQPLESATIASQSPKAFATTNGDGQTDIALFKGAGTIEIRMVGYRAEIKSYAELERAAFIVFLTQSTVNLDEVVASATRWNQLSRDVPTKIAVLSPRELTLQNPQTAADLLGTSGEVFIQKSQQGGGSPMIRGFATNRLLYVVDGVRMNTAIFRSGNLQNVISLDPFAIERTEIFFGPGSVIYGSDAIGGVMAFQTLTPQFSLSDEALVNGSASMRFSSANNENTAHVDARVGGRAWASVTSFSSSDFDDLLMGSSGPTEYLRPFHVQRHDGLDVVVTNDDLKRQRPSGYSQINLMQKLRFRPDEEWDSQYGFHYSETSDYSRYDRHVRYRNGLPRYGEWYYGPQKWLMNNFSLAHDGTTGLYDQMTIRLAHQFFEESRIDRNINDNERHIRREKVYAYSANLDFHTSIGGEQRLFYGLEAVYNDITSIGVDEDISANVAVPGPARYPQSNWGSYGAYVSYQHKLTDQFLVQAGARYNLYKLDATFDTTFYPFPYTTADISDGALTGSLGAVYRPTAEWAISANLSTGFRSPNVDDAGKVFDSAPGSVIIPNPDLNAEYAYNAELGIARVFGDAVKIDVTGYYTSLEDALVRRDFTLNGADSIVYDGTLSRVQAIQNAAVATVYGIQAGIDVQLPSGFGLSTDFNYQKGEEEVDDGSTSPSRHAPPWFGVSRLTYSANRLNMQFYAFYSGERVFDDLPQEEQAKTEIYAIDANGNPWSPGWYTLNFKIMYQFAENFSLSAGLENLTDRRYRPYSSGIVAPGRNFITALHVRI